MNATPFYFIDLNMAAAVFEPNVSSAPESVSCSGASFFKHPPRLLAARLMRNMGGSFSPAQALNHAPGAHEAGPLFRGPA